MSERRLLGLLLLLLTLGAPLQGQEKERLARREAELTARLALLEARYRAGDSTRFADQRRSVVSAGAFHVAFPEWAGAEGERLIPELVEERRRRYGMAVDSLLTDTLYIWVDDSVRGDDATLSELKWRMGRLHGDATVTVSGVENADWVTWVASQALERWAQSIVDTMFTRWLGTTSQRTDPEDLRDGAVRELILAPSSRARRCLDGVVEECALLLELAEVPDPLLQAYDPADYRGMVQRVQYGSAGRARCLTGREVAACAAILQRHGNRPLRAVSARVRQSLVTFALVRGGDSAWLRLSRSAGRPVGEQLAEVSGLPLETLIAEWRRDLREERRTTEAGLGTAFLMALGWSVIGWLFFVWRYRWRHV